MVDKTADRKGVQEYLGSAMRQQVSRGSLISDQCLTPSNLPFLALNRSF